MNLKSTWWCLVLLLCAGIANAQATYFISAQLIDADTGKPIQHATVSPVGYAASLSVLTDELGMFYLELDSLPNQLYVHSLQYNELISYSPPDEGTYVIALHAKNHHIGEAEVTAFQLENKQLAAPANIGVVSAQDLDNSDGSDLQWALNQIPGVFMETRGYGGSRRLNIRGTTVRSPFAVRNVKLYLDELPLTSPDGSSPLELIDPEDIAQIEVIKGPSGSAYGSINGGTILFTPMNAEPGLFTIKSHVQAGSFGYVRSSQALSLSTEKFKLRLHRVDQSLDGYRSQEFNHKEQSTLSLNIKASNRLQYFIWATDYAGKWGLPGAINAEDATEDPTQARVFALQNNTRVERGRQYVGIRQRWTTRYFSNQTALYVAQTKKVNPYGTSAFFNGYKNEVGSGFGGRTKFTGTLINWRAASLSGSAGGEFQLDNNHLDEFELVNGLPADPKFSNATESVQGTAFTGIQYRYQDQLFVEAGIGWTETIYTNNGTNFNLEGDSANLRARLPYRALLPRVAASIEIRPNIFGYVNYSTGTSAPSVFEVVNPYDGRFSKQLHSEDAVNYEVGLKGYSTKWDVQGEFTVYRMIVNDPILENPASEGPLYFNIHDRRIQQGAEAWCQKDWEFDRTHVLAKFSAHLSGSWNQYTYRSDSLHVAGTPFSTAQLQLSATTRNGIEFILSDRWTDAMFLNSAGTVKSNPYHLGQLEIQYKSPVLGQHWKFEFQFGVRNLWNASYSSFFQLDGVFGRYYNPAPPRSMFGGVSLMFTWPS